MQYVIFHGSFGSSKENWFPWLEKKLVSDGHEVYNIDFPVENYQEMTKAGQGNYVVKNQNLYNWMKYFESNILNKLDTLKPVGFIAHSISPLFVLHILQTHVLDVSIGIFVGAFLEELTESDWQVDQVNFSFYDTDIDWKDIQEQELNTYSLYSDNDPYVDAEYSLRFAEKIDSSPIMVSGAGHFNSDAGWTDAPLVLKLCRSVSQ